MNVEKRFRPSPALPAASLAALVAAGCYTDSPPRPPAPPAPIVPPYASYPPAPYGYNQPPPGYPASPGYPAAPAPIPAPPSLPGPPPAPFSLAQLFQAESAQRSAIRATPPPPAPNVLAQINVAALAAVSRMFPKGCAPFAVAPGTYVHLDCRRYGRVADAKVVNPANKIRMFQSGQLRLDPQAIGGVTPPLLLTGLQALFGGAAPAPAPQPGPAQGTPDSVDHRAQGTEGPVKDQGVVGACTAFSLSTVMDNAIRRLNKADVISAMHVWSRYADPTMPSAEGHNEGRPLSLWADYPYDASAACRMESQDDGCAELLVPPVRVGTAASDATIQSQIRSADARGRYTIGEVDQIDPIDPDVLAVDLATGKDIWFAMGVSQDAWTSAIVQTTGVVPDWQAEDGGHAVALAGYRSTPLGRQFLVHNSWSESWGDHGYAWVSEAMLRTHGQYAYTIKLVDGAAPAPPPTPVPTPQPGGGSTCAAGFVTVPGIPLCQKLCSTSADCGGGGVCARVNPAAAQTVCVATNPLTDDDCGEGELVDLVTGQCAPTCASGLRPAAGFCPFR